MVLNKAYSSIIKLNKSILRKSDVILTASYDIPRYLLKNNLRDEFVIYTQHCTGDDEFTFHKDLYEYDCIYLKNHY